MWPYGHGSHILIRLSALGLVSGRISLPWFLMVISGSGGSSVAVPLTEHFEVGLTDLRRSRIWDISGFRLVGSWLVFDSTEMVVVLGLVEGWVRVERLGCFSKMIWFSLSLSLSVLILAFRLPIFFKFNLK